MAFSKIWLLPLLLLSITFVLVDQGLDTPASYWFGNREHKVVAENALHLNPQVGLVFYEGEPFNGEAIRYYENGNKAASTIYQKGKKQGVARKWFIHGELSYEAQYQNGKKQGITKTWWKNTKLRSLSNYEKGIAHGLQLQWYFSGAKFKRINLNHGIEQGLQQSWRENGKIYNNYEAVNGRIFGLKRANLCYELDNEIIQYKE